MDLNHIEAGGLDTPGGSLEFFDDFLDIVSAQAVAKILHIGVQLFARGISAVGLGNFHNRGHFVFLMKNLACYFGAVFVNRFGKRFQAGNKTVIENRRRGRHTGLWRQVAKDDHADAAFGQGLIKIQGFGRYFPFFPRSLW